MNKKCGIYCIKNIQNGLVYIGSSKNIDQRWSSHKCMLNKNIHFNCHLQNAWNKYNAESFSFVILELCVQEILTEREIYWMNFYESYDRKKGYNLERYIDERKEISAETKEKISKARKGRSTMSDEAKQRLSERIFGEKNINYGKPRSKNVIDKIKLTKALNPPIGDKNPFFGKKHSEETKKKISENNEKRAASNRLNRAKMSLEEEYEFYKRWIAGETAKKLVKETSMSLSGFKKIVKKWDIKINGTRTIDERCTERTERWKKSEEV